ncbi:WG repeat-containing protein [Paenibacillus mendelii]|uniref:WG repeat-containing protein n=1 Tax=Paenibacillus mendelii TaxID=206163 RepID=A0ABV6JK97_9BACL
MDRDGRFVIEPVFEFARFFSGGIPMYYKWEDTVHFARWRYNT